MYNEIYLKDGGRITISIPDSNIEGETYKYEGAIYQGSTKLADPEDELDISLNLVESLEKEALQLYREIERLRKAQE